MKKVRKHIWVSGKVQGVFYRQSTFEAAISAGITGWVRNLKDGRVEAVIEGESSTVERLLLWCKSGPPAAIVTKIEVIEENCETEFDSFTVKPTV